MYNVKINIQYLISWIPVRYMTLNKILYYLINNNIGVYYISKYGIYIRLNYIVWHITENYSAFLEYIIEKNYDPDKVGW